MVEQNEFTYLVSGQFNTRDILVGRLKTIDLDERVSGKSLEKDHLVCDQPHASIGGICSSERGHGEDTQRQHEISSIQSLKRGYFYHPMVADLVG